MQKLLLVLIAAALACACNNATKEPKKEPSSKRSDLKNMHMAGMVKTIEEADYTPDSLGNIGAMDSCCVEVEVYNKKGFEIVYMEKDITGTVTVESTNTLNENNNFMSSINTKGGQPNGGRKAVRDADGKLLSGVDTDGDGNVKYFYTDIIENEHGQPISGKMYTGDSTFIGTWGINMIDGMEVGRSWKDSLDNLLYDYKGEVNDKGWLIKQTGKVTIGEDSFKTTVSTFAYDSLDETGNWTQRTERDGDGKVLEVKKRTYTYFKNE